MSVWTCESVAAEDAERLQCAVLRLDALSTVEVSTRALVSRLKDELAQAVSDLLTSERARREQEEEVSRSRCFAEESIAREELVMSTNGRRLRWLGIARRRREVIDGLGECEEEKIRASSRVQIGKDVRRTFAALNMGLEQEEEAEAAKRLEKVLTGLSARAEEEESAASGYVQGMNMRVAAPVILLRDDQDAFATASLLVEEAVPPGFWAAFPPLAGMLATKDILVEEITRRLPRLSSTLGSQLPIFCSLLAPAWLIPLFVGIVPTAVALTILDDVLMACSDG
eukprot:Hpha_TRINITY_DN16657_c0_g3::TRINITY_DN16657_c0_g3_i1::g.178438::m.178438